MQVGNWISSNFLKIQFKFIGSIPFPLDAEGASLRDHDGEELGFSLAIRILATFRCRHSLCAMISCSSAAAIGSPMQILSRGLGSLSLSGRIILSAVARLRFQASGRILIRRTI